MVRQLPLPPEATSSNVSKVMKANKAKNTKPELALRNFLWTNGYKGYRLNWKKASGRPDVCYPRKKLAIFVHGCFWHRCPVCSSELPKSNTEFWRKKFELNKARDCLKRESLEAQGWKVLELWECEIKRTDFSRVLKFLA